MNCEFKLNDINELRCIYCNLKVPIKLLNVKIISDCRKLNNFQKAKNYTKAFIQHKINGSQECKEPELTIRREICKTCRHLAPDQSCLYCGCPTQNKSLWLEQQCPVGKWPKSMGLLFRATHSDADIPCNLENLYLNNTCFFIGAGPSINKIPSEIWNRLSDRGIVTFSVNNVAAKLIRPTFWCSADDPLSFHENIWNDPSIIKFVRRSNFYKVYRTGQFVRDCPATYYFDINEDFNPETYLTEPTICFGNHTNTYDEQGHKGGRFSMFLAIRLMYYLGFRKIYLVGCDFEMNSEQPYAFKENKHTGGVSTNNDKYFIFNERLKQLQPIFLQKKFQIFNCNSNSKLTAFPFKDLELALNETTCGFDKNPNLEGMYGKNT